MYVHRYNYKSFQWLNIHLLSERWTHIQKKNISEDKKTRIKRKKYRDYGRNRDKEREREREREKG